MFNCEPLQYLIVSLLILSGSVGAVPLDRFYPFGLENNDRSLPRSDDGGSLLNLETGYIFFGEFYNTIYVSA